MPVSSTMKRPPTGGFFQKQRDVMKLVVIDGQGGGVGKGIIESVRRELPGIEIVAVGTNAMATAAMLRAGADTGATGENAALYNCGRCDVIAGAMGIAFAHSMHGEISPAVAQAVSMSGARKLLVPMSQCNAQTLGVQEKPLSAYFADLVAALRQMLSEA